MIRRPVIAWSPKSGKTMRRCPLFSKVSCAASSVIPRQAAQILSCFHRYGNGISGHQDHINRYYELFPDLPCPLRKYARETRDKLRGFNIIHPFPNLCRSNHFLPIHYAQRNLRNTCQHIRFTPISL